MSLAPDVFVTVAPRSPHRVGCALAVLAAWCAEQKAGRVGRIITMNPRGVSSQLLHILDLAGYGLGLHIDQAVTMDADVGPASQRARHALAAQLATTPVYVLADDDCVLHRSRHLTFQDEGEDTPWPAYVAGLLDAQPDLAMLAPIPMPDTVSTGTLAAFLARVTNDPAVAGLAARLALPHERAHVWRVTSVGGIRFVRRGAIPADLDALPPVEPERGGGYDLTLGAWLRGTGDRERCGYLTRLGLTHYGYEWSQVYAGPLGDPIAGGGA